MDLDVIAVRGASEHNLQAVDVDIPKNRLVVFTGVSGSGKSSLAFDTLFAEGQRRYVESLSTYARQFLGQLERPAYDSIRGLAPTIAIEQKSASSNPRSTVGTVTELHDYLRVLYARVGKQHCHQCGRPVARQDAQQIVRSIESLSEGTRFLLLAPLARGRKGTFAEAFGELARDGFTRVRVDGAVRDLVPPPELERNQKHDIDLVVDRLAVREGIHARLTDSVETALRHGEGRLVVAPVDGADLLYSERLACEHCGISLPERSPQLFSFNSPLGMCPECNGLGTSLQVDPAEVVPDDSLSLAEGAVTAWPRTDREGSWSADILKGVAATAGFSLDTPWRDLSDAQRAAVLDGLEDPIEVAWNRGDGGNGVARMRFEGVGPRILRLFKETQSEAQRRYYAGFLEDAPCPACEGTRLRAEARAVSVAGRSLTEMAEMSVDSLDELAADLDMADAPAEIVGPLQREIRNRLRFLRNVGLGYLSLARSAATLSGGEAQRIRLASQIGSELTGVLYVLDEPSIGLHPRDNRRLVDALEALRDLGNSVVVVEHDETTIRAADCVVDFGPGAGRRGGRVLYTGPPSGLEDVEESLTGAYLSGRAHIPRPARRRAPSGWLTVREPRANNLKGNDVRFPLGAFSVVTGVSGAGKSSLVSEILYPALARRLHRAGVHPGPHAGIDGLAAIDKVINIDQKPIGRTPRSNPATYTKVFDLIRKAFSTAPEARVRGFEAGRFSFNVKGGRCEHCQGGGVLRVEMHFLSDVFVTCPECDGRRFNDATLKVHYKGLDIAEVLRLTVDEAASVFENHPAIRRILATLQDVGLGYLELGQPSPTLSGGEAQRIKLSRELARASTGNTLYVMDEPSTGLHFDDVRKLLAVVNQLVDGGNTVVMIEHNPEIVWTADHVIDLGPEGGAAGGDIVATGTPEDVAANAASHTGRALLRFAAEDSNGERG